MRNLFNVIWERFRVIRARDGRADVQIFDTRDENDVAGLSGGRFLAFKTFELKNLIDLAALRRIFRTVHEADILTGGQGAAVHAADTDLADVARVVERADLKNQVAVRIVFT